MKHILEQFVAASKGRMFSPTSYRGSTFSYRCASVVFVLRDRLRTFQRRLRQWIRSPATSYRMTQYFRHMKRGEWNDALRKAVEIADIAERERNARLMREMSVSLMLLGEYQRSSQLQLASRRASGNNDAKEWMGDDIPGQTLLINLAENPSQGMGGSIRAGRLLGEAARHAARCIVLVQPRLVPLFKRTFPDIDVRPAGVNSKAAYEEADKIAYFDHLPAYLAPDEQQIVSTFLALRPDPKDVEEFSARYRQSGPRPLVGISWGSTAYAKDIPDIADWPPLLRAVDATFVSLQYGKVDADLAILRKTSGRTVIADASVDQIVDMDRFAAQISALDAVVSISNTGAHLTGALGIPMIVINGDNLRRAWPVTTDRIPWYPNTLIVGKRNRPWHLVMSEVRDRLSDMLVKRR